MILGSAVLTECIYTGAIVAKHGEEYVQDLQIGPNSIDVRLAEDALSLGAFGCVDPMDDNGSVYTQQTKFPKVLAPGDAILGCTKERFIVSPAAKEVIVRYVPVLKDVDFSIVQEYHGRSTCGRLFLASHVTAGFGDVGFRSAWTLEIVNLHPSLHLRLSPGMRIGQIQFSVVIGADKQYNGAYCSQHTAPLPPIIGSDRF
jgi:dCTP deaminase